MQSPLVDVLIYKGSAVDRKALRDASAEVLTAVPDLGVEMLDGVTPATSKQLTLHLNDADARV